MPTTTTLCASWATVDASAPRCRPKPRTKPRPMRPVPRCRSMTAIFARSRAGVRHGLAGARRSAPRRATRSRSGPATSPITRARPPAPRDAEHLGAERADRTVCRTHSGTSACGISATGRPALSTSVGHEPLEVGEQQQVGLVARRDRAEVGRARAKRGVQRRADERVLGRDPGRDRVAHHRVDVPVVGDVLRLAVVGAERDPARAVLRRRSGSSACRFRAAEASRISSHIPARSRSRPSSAVYASWSERMPAAAYALSVAAEHAGRVAVDVLARARASPARARRRR